MPRFEFAWTEATIEHLAEHDVSPEDFEHVVRYPYSQGTSRSSDLPYCWGETPDGRFIMCVYDEIDELTLLPVAAYEVPRPGERHI